MGKIMSDRLNILLISNLFPNPVDPIRGVFTLQLAKQLSAMCDLTVLCPLPWFPRWANIGFLKKWGAFSSVPVNYEWQGFSVHSPKYMIIPKLSETIHALLMFPSLYLAVRRLHRKKRFDAVNTQWLYPDGVAAGWITSLLKIPHVMTALGCDANLFMKQGNKRPQIERALKKADGVTVVSEALRQFLVEEGFQDKQIDVIPNGVDAELFYPRDRAECIKQLGLSHKGKAVVFVGQLLEVKGIIYLIEAVERLVKAGKEYTFYLVGEGEGRTKYEDEITQRGLSKQIYFAGNRPHSEVALWMGACDVFCLPSIREGFPNVVLEALFSGRPVVASRVGGIPEMVNERNGFLVKPMNSELLAECLLEALEREWDDRTILSTVSSFTWERAAEQYFNVLERAIGK
jgi:teichuronic acid biosynthesis glycosyltransferase TuaC